MAEPATTPAAPAAAPTPPAGSTIDARIALAKSMGAAPRLTAEAPASNTTTNIDEPPGTEAPAVEAAPEPEAEAEGEEKQTPAAAPGTVDEMKAAATTALEKGDIDALVAALGVDGSKVNAPVRRAFRAHARRQQKLDRERTAFTAERSKATQELSAESNRISQLQRHVATKYAPFEAGVKAWQDEDFLALGKALEKQYNTDLATFTQRLASGKVGKTEPEKAIAAQQAKLDADRAAFEAEKKKAEASKGNSAKRVDAVAKVGELLKAHVYIAGADGKVDPEALEEVFAEYDKSWNGERFTKTPQKIADELQAKLVARATKRGLAPVAKAPAVAPKKVTTPKAPRLPEPPRTTPRKDLGTPEDLEASRALRIANAKAVTERQRRGLAG